MKVTAIHSGAQDDDLIVYYVVLPQGMDVQAQHDAYRTWHSQVYSPRTRPLGQNPDFMTFYEWLVKHGARDATEDEITIFNDEL